MKEKSHYSDLRVLVVDDHNIMRTLVSQHLRDIGVEKIESVSDGTEAMDYIRAAYDTGYPYHIVFLDWHIPKIQGLDVLQRCRADKKCDNMAIVMLTAEQEEKNIMKALQSGATSYLVKPVSYETFDNNMKKVLGWLDKRTSYFPSSGAVQGKSSRQDNLVAEAVPGELRKELMPVITGGMAKIFSELFHVQIVPEEERGSDGTDMVCVGRLRKNDFLILLRFFFTQDLLRPLLSQIYSRHYLDNGGGYEDAACGIVNILCSQVKAFLGGKGYALELDFPEMKVQDEKCGKADSFMNVYFSLNKDNVFSVDLATDA